jgi:hypothetical protein
MAFVTSVVIIPTCSLYPFVAFLIYIGFLFVDLRFDIQILDLKQVYLFFIAPSIYLFYHLHLNIEVMLGSLLNYHILQRDVFIITTFVEVFVSMMMFSVIFGLPMIFVMFNNYKSVMENMPYSGISTAILSVLITLTAVPSQLYLVHLLISRMYNPEYDYYENNKGKDEATKENTSN